MTTLDGTRGHNLRILRFLALHPDGASLYDLKRGLGIDHQVARSYAGRLARNGHITLTEEPAGGQAGYKRVARLAPPGAMAVLLAERSSNRPQMVDNAVPGGC